MTARVLVVEDECRLRRAVRSFLELRGFDVREAGSLREARALIGATSFDAAILDVILPDGSGLDLVSALGAGRTLVVSAHEQLESAPDARPRFMPKPFDLHALESVVSELAGAR